MDITFHYPPELTQLLIDTIPLLCRSKKDVLLFFQGAGVGSEFTSDLAQRVRRDRESITKFEIVRTVLTRINERGEPALRQRREVLKRVVEFDDFSTCWPNDQLKARGLVAQIQNVANVKDTFTRISQERSKERKQRMAKQAAEKEAIRKKREALAEIRRDLVALFSAENKHKRGKALEGILDRLFKVNGIQVKEAFTIRGDSGEGIIEEIDGVVKVEGHHYLVGMKWWKNPIGKSTISQDLVTIYHRGQSRGFFISASGFTAPAVVICREALQKTVVSLCDLEEIVLLLERDVEFKGFFLKKINAAISEKNPFHKPLECGDL